MSANRGGGRTGNEGGAAAGGGLGKVLGGLFTVTDLSDGTVIGSAITDSETGLVTVRTCTRTGPFLLTLEGQTGANYYDEGLNQLIPFPSGSVLHALVDTWDEHVGVSPFTEAAFRYALNNYRANPATIIAGTVALLADGSAVGLTTEQVQAANSLVISQINDRIITAYKMTSVKSLPTPIDATSASTALQNTAYGRSAAVNGGFVKAAGQYNTSLTSPALALVNDLARDLTDGRIDGFALDGTPVNTAASVTYASVRLPIGGMVGANAVAQQFGQINSKKTVDETSLLLAGSNFDGTNNCNGWNDRVALLSDGSVTLQRAFPKQLGGGLCDFNQLTTTLESNFLTDVKLLSNSGNTIFAVKNDGSVVGWGSNFCGKLSPALAQTLYQTPQTIVGVNSLVSIYTDSASTIARDKTGTVSVWGNVAGAFSVTNTPPAGYSFCYLQSGSPSIYRFSANAIQQVSVPNAVDVYTSAQNYFVRTATGDVYAWGSGLRGLLGNGVSTFICSGQNCVSPIPITSPTLMSNLSKVRSLGFMNGTAFALMQDGSIKGWGDDNQLYLGNGIQRLTFVPTTISGLSNINIMGVSPYFGLRMVQFDGAAISWGPSIGSGVYVNSGLPVVVAISGRIRHLTGEGGFFNIYYDSGDVRDEFNVGYTTNQIYGL